MKRVHITNITMVLLSFGPTGCAELLDPNYGYGGNPYGNGYYGGGYGNSGYYDPYYNNNNRRREQQLNREQEELQEERRRIDAQRREVEAQRYTPPAPRQEHCPSGFSPSENKCSPAERKHGCRDMRLPGGLGCVSR